jgi:Mg2+/Co2+ transporter CorC
VDQDFFNVQPLLRSNIETPQSHKITHMLQVWKDYKNQKSVVSVCLPLPLTAMMQG